MNFAKLIDSASHATNEMLRVASHWTIIAFRNRASSLCKYIILSHFYHPESFNGYVNDLCKYTWITNIPRISFANEAMPTTSARRTTYFICRFPFLRGCLLFRVFKRDGFADGRWWEVGFMNFPVEENALDLSTRQIGWEKRKQVKEATTVTAVTTTSGFSLLLDSFNHPPVFFRIFPSPLRGLIFSYAPVFLLASYVRLSFFTKAFLNQYAYREIRNCVAWACPLLSILFSNYLIIESTIS